MVRPFCGWVPRFGHITHVSDVSSEFRSVVQTLGYRFPGTVLAPVLRSPSARGWTSPCRVTWAAFRSRSVVKYLGRLPGAPWPNGVWAYLPSFEGVELGGLPILLYTPRLSEIAHAVVLAGPASILFSAPAWSCFWARP